MHSNILSLSSPFAITLSPPSPKQTQSETAADASSPDMQTAPEAGQSLAAPLPGTQAPRAPQPSPIKDCFQPTFRRLDWRTGALTGALDDNHGIAAPFDIPAPSESPPPLSCDPGARAAVLRLQADLTAWPRLLVATPAHMHAAPPAPTALPATPVASAAPLWHSPLLTRSMRRALSALPTLPPPLSLDPSSTSEPLSTEPTRRPTKRQRTETEPVVCDGQLVGQVKVKDVCISVMRHNATLYISVAHFCQALGVSDGNSKREFRRLTPEMKMRFGRNRGSASVGYFNYVTLAGAQEMAAYRRRPFLGQELASALEDANLTR